MRSALQDRRATGTPFTRSCQRCLCAAALAIALAAAGCLSERERLVPPTVAIELAATSFAPGDSVAGHASARDRSGLVLLVIEAVSGDSSYLARHDRSDVSTIELDFLLPVALTATPGSEIVITATATDDQMFSATATATAVVAAAP